MNRIRKWKLSTMSSDLAVNLVHQFVALWHRSDYWHLNAKLIDRTEAIRGRNF